MGSPVGVPIPGNAGASWLPHLKAPFPSCAALPTKRPPAPTLSTATESASGLAAKPSVRTWGSLSSKCHLFWGSFVCLRLGQNRAGGGGDPGPFKHPKACTQSWRRRKHSRRCCWCCPIAEVSGAGLEWKVTLPRQRMSFRSTPKAEQGLSGGCGGGQSPGGQGRQRGGLGGRRQMADGTADTACGLRR